MSRVLRDPTLQTLAIEVPVPGSWDPIAQAAYEQGRADGYTHGHSIGYSEGFDTGRHDLSAVADRMVHAATRCFDEVRVLHADLVTRVIELADLYVRTVVRGVPDASASGMLARIEEALASLEPGALELTVRADVVAELTALFAEHERALQINVVAGELEMGEYRIRSEWAEVDGTWDRYVHAANEAMTMYLVEHEQ